MTEQCYAYQYIQYTEPGSCVLIRITTGPESTEAFISTDKHPVYALGIQITKCARFDISIWTKLNGSHASDVNCLPLIIDDVHIDTFWPTAAWKLPVAVISMIIIL